MGEQCENYISENTERCEEIVMDNDNALKKKLVKLYRDTKLKIDYTGMKLLSEEGGNKRIKQLTSGQTSFMVGRFGAVEMHCVSRWMAGENCTQEERNQALYAAGIFPNDQVTINKFCEVYTGAMKMVDVLGVWEVTGEKKAIKKYCSKIELIPSRAIEPYYFPDPWSAALEGKRVLVLHPFVESIKKQIGQREKIWEDRNVLPQFASVEYVKAIQSNAGGTTKYPNWFAALDNMKNEISKANFEIAIIGAGAYGLPLAAYVKTMGKQAVQMSGATQVLFGIKGKRWDTHPVISKFYNEAWVRPLKIETPPEIKKVEGGSYW